MSEKKKQQKPKPEIQNNASFYGTKNAIDIKKKRNFVARILGL